MRAACVQCGGDEFEIEVTPQGAFGICGRCDLVQDVAELVAKAESRNASEARMRRQIEMARSRLETLGAAIGGDKDNTSAIADDLEVVAGDIEGIALQLRAGVGTKAGEIERATKDILAERGAKAVTP